MYIHITFCVFLEKLLKLFINFSSYDEDNEFVPTIAKYYVNHDDNDNCHHLNDDTYDTKSLELWKR